MLFKVSRFVVNIFSWQHWATVFTTTRWSLLAAARAQLFTTNLLSVRSILRATLADKLVVNFNQPTSYKLFN